MHRHGSQDSINSGTYFMIENPLQADTTAEVTPWAETSPARGARSYVPPHPGLRPAAIQLPLPTALSPAITTEGAGVGSLPSSRGTSRAPTPPPPPIGFSRSATPPLPPPSMGAATASQGSGRWRAAPSAAPHSRLDVTPLGLAATSWPEVPVASEGGPAPGAATPQWFASAELGLSGSLPDDEGLASDGGDGTFNTPVLPKGKVPFYSDSAAAEPSSRGSALQAGRSGRGCSSGCMGIVGHFVGLIFAAHPLRKHREWSGKLLVAGHSEGSSGAEGIAGRSRTPGLRRKHTGLKRRLASSFPCASSGAPARKTKAVGIDERYANNKKRRRLVYALRRQQARGGYKSMWDRLANEVFIAGELAFDRATPARLRSHLPWFAATFLALNFITFAFMAGEFPLFLRANPASAPCAMEEYGSGPRGLARWVVTWSPCYTFTQDFLVLWGARFAPLMHEVKHCWRWGSSLLLADSFVHLVANALLFGALALHLEGRFGTPRIVLVAAVAGLGGNFFDAAVGDMCRAVMPAAGVSVGLLALFLVDIFLNFEAIRYPILRLVGVAICLGAFTAAALLTGYPFRYTPLGGFLAALLPGMVFLPHVKSEKFEWFLPYLASLACAAFLVGLPLYIYLYRLARVVC